MSSILGAALFKTLEVVRRPVGREPELDKIFAQDSHIGEATSILFGPNGRVYVGTFSDGVLRFDQTTGAFLDTFIANGTGGLGTNITGLALTNQPH